MKKKSLSGKLNLGKNVISALNDIKGGNNELAYNSDYTPCMTTMTRMNCFSQVVICGTGSLCVPVDTWYTCY